MIFLVLKSLINKICTWLFDCSSHGSYSVEALPLSSEGPVWGVRPSLSVTTHDQKHKLYRLLGKHLLLWKITVNPLNNIWKEQEDTPHGMNNQTLSLLSSDKCPTTMSRLGPVPTNGRLFPIGENLPVIKTYHETWTGSIHSFIQMRRRKTKGSWTDCGCIRIQPAHFEWSPSHNMCYSCPLQPT